MEKPLVSVICICFNHERFVREAIESVLHQSYQPVELIIIDDNSTDNSVEVIHQIIKSKAHIKFIANTINIGNCKSFNKAFQHANGEFIIDLAADDMLEPKRIEKGVEAFLKHPNAGVNFSDAYYINFNSKIIKPHYKRDKKGKLKEDVPTGKIYKEILKRYFICSPTMMYTRKAVELMSGYDENLAYEDFDFQVRSSRQFDYIYTDEILVKKRVLKNSLSTKQYLPNSKILYSTWKICEKAYLLNQTKEEHEALKKRIYYELRQSILSKNHHVAENFLNLLNKMGDNGITSRFYNIILKLARWFR